jgi:hypothetical protein
MLVNFEVDESAAYSFVIRVSMSTWSLSVEHLIDGVAMGLQFAGYLEMPIQSKPARCKVYVWG